MKRFIRIPLSGTNCYLIEAPHGCILVDCGSCRDQKPFRKAMKKARLPLSSIRYLVLTHHHRDHCGLLSFLIMENPAIRVVMSEKCAKFLETGKNCIQPGERYASDALGRAMNFYFRFHRHLSKEGDPYSLRSGDILVKQDASFDDIIPGSQILLTPGHTEDSLSLVAGTIAFAGDTVRNRLNFLGSKYLPILLYDQQEWLASLKKLRESGVQVLCPAHGNPLNIRKLPHIE